MPEPEMTLVDSKVLSDLHQNLFNADLALADAKVLHEREINGLEVRNAVILAEGIVIWWLLIALLIVVL